MTLEELIRKVVRYMNERGMFEDVKKNFKGRRDRSVETNKRACEKSEKRG